MENPVISGVAHDTSAVKFTVAGVPGKARDLAAIFRAMADARVTLDTVAVAETGAAPNLSDVTFLVSKRDFPQALQALEHARLTVGFTSLLYDDHVAKISLVGSGLGTSPGMTATFVGALSNAGLGTDLIAASGGRISAVVHGDDAERAVRALHTAFGPDRAQHRSSCPSRRSC